MVPSSAALDVSPSSQSTRSGSHSVEFYDNEAVFLDGMSGFVFSALNSGGVCVIIATAPHRQGLAQRLRAFGIDLSIAVQNQQYLLLDAEATLAKFMVNGWPDQAAFFATLEPVLLQAKASLGPNAPFPVAFGEMVALLWADGKRDAAVRLEELWNELARRHAFALRCAYPRGGFAQDEMQTFFDRICAAHTHVITSGLPD